MVIVTTFFLLAAVYSIGPRFSSKSCLVLIHNTASTNIFFRSASLFIGDVPDWNLQQ
ncbi:hypothetical protein [Nitrosopumilus piranensis]|uniref:hypothetical protein n=1 Tax=Nitrosopumilus piranensis TaxID=1582439 RepID=UPI000AC15291|nr:hypothetical protein [Nitrosopumilus piranensis]